MTNYIDFWLAKAIVEGGIFLIVVLLFGIGAFVLWLTGRFK